MSVIQDRESNVEAISNELSKCGDFLVKLSNTCCLKERSKSMNALVAAFGDLESNLEKDTQNLRTVDDVIKRIIDIGGSIGSLHVSCCTKTRETIYQKLLTSLNEIHTHLWAMKGVGH